MTHVDPEVNRLYKQQWYKKNKAKTQATSKATHARYRVRIREWLWNYKLEHPCVDCGENDPRVLDFDHVSGDKQFQLSDTSSRYFSMKRIEIEIAKCEVRCANCHRKVTYDRQFGSKTGLGPVVQ